MFKKKIKQNKEKKYVFRKWVAKLNVNNKKIMSTGYDFILLLC